jgi:hypothetical protein
VGDVMSDEINDVSMWLTRLQTSADRIERAGVVAGANEAAKAGVRAFAGSDSLNVPVRGLRAAPRIKAAIEAGMEAEFKQVSA